MSVAAWSSVCLLLVLLPLLLCGKLRVKDSQEKAGIDEAKMKEPAYMIPSWGSRKVRQAGCLPYIYVLTDNSSDGGGRQWWWW